jgi:arsenate reductase-like glutaredoxin family protein
LSATELAAIAAAAGLTPLGIINTRSPSYRELAVKPGDDAAALALLAANPKVMIRPALATAGRARFGFSEAGFQDMVGW